MILLSATIFPLFLQTGYILMQKNFPKASDLQEAIRDVSFIDGVSEVVSSKIFNLDGVTKILDLKVHKSEKIAR